MYLLYSTVFIIIVAIVTLAFLPVLAYFPAGIFAGGGGAIIAMGLILNKE